MDRQADGVADARRVDSFVRPIGVERQDVRAARLALIVTDVRARSNGNEEDLSVRRELHVASPVSAAADLFAAARNVLDDDLGRPPRLGITVLVWEPDDRVCVAHVDVRGIGTGRIEGDSKWPAQSRGELISRALPCRRHRCRAAA